MTTLYIKAHNYNSKIFYTEHSTYHYGDAGLDLFSPEDITIYPGETKFIDLGISCQMKTDTKNVSYYMYARSSISKTPLILANSVGIIDSAYTGSIISAFRNIGTEKYTIKKGDRLVQICAPNLGEFKFELVDDLTPFISSKSNRGTGGFGSTGR